MQWRHHLAHPEVTTSLYVSFKQLQRTIAREIGSRATGLHRHTITVKMLYTTTCKSPVGALQLVASSQGLVAVLWPNHHGKRLPFQQDELLLKEDHPILVTACQQLHEYFAGSRQSFDVPLDLRGSIFQVQCCRLACVPQLLHNVLW
jgi:hypothetical protein